MQFLADMKPAFLRFPGSNYLEGNTITTASIGGLAPMSRLAHVSLWQLD